ncbi:MAG: TonB-dependent receptor [Bacteroidetes bacterium]|nr:TonB-dependent receptor [Bacteroidota bacterium]
MKAKINFVTSLFLSSFLCNSASSLAQSDTGSYKLEDVVIQSERMDIPFSKQNRDIVILDSKAIKDMPVQSLNEILGYISGVDLRQRGPWGGQADVSINGGTFDQTLILLNGVRIIDPQTGHNMMNLPINPQIIDRIEIMKGAAASAYGINALSGVINIVTKNPDENNVWVDVSSGSSFRSDTSNNKMYGGTNLNVSASFNNKNMRHLISLSSLNSSGYRYNTAMSNQKAYYQNQIDLKNQNTIRLMGGFVYNDFGANAFYAAPGDIESREIVQTGLAAAKGDFKISKLWNFRPSLSYRYGYDDYIYIRKKPSVYRNQHFTHVAEASLNNMIKTRIGIIGFGAEYRFETIRSNSLGKRERNNFGFYANYSFERIKNLTSNIGAYLNYSKHFGWKLLPSLDAGYQINEKWRVFSNIGTGTRIPTYTDWYYKGPQNIGNSNLMPENAIHSELGARFNNKKNLRMSLIAFHHTTTDFIDWTKDSLAAPWQPENFQTITFNGITAAADYISKQGFIHPENKLLLGVSYTRLEPKIESINNEVPVISHYALENLTDQLIIHLGIKFKQSYSATIAGRYEQRIRKQDYWLLDAKFDVSFGNFIAYLNLNNLLNITYIEAGAVPLPGRWVSVGLMWQMKKQ